MLYDQTSEYFAYRTLHVLVGDIRSVRVHQLVKSSLAIRISHIIAQFDLTSDLVVVAVQDSSLAQYLIMSL